MSRYRQLWFDFGRPLAFMLVLSVIAYFAWRGLASVLVVQWGLPAAESGRVARIAVLILFAFAFRFFDRSDVGA